MQKVEIKQLKINKLKEKVNEEFKKIYLLDAKLSRDIETANFRGQKIKLMSEKNDIQRNYFFTRYYYNIKKSLILIKTFYLNVIISYYLLMNRVWLQHVNSEDLEKLINQNGLIKFTNYIKI